MRLLLDTCTFLWIVGGSRELSAKSRAWFRDPSNDVMLSSVSAWEIAQKYALGKLPLPGTPERWIPAMRESHGIDTLPMDEESALQLHRLPALHRDPFDRMLVCQAIVHGLAILTPDRLISQYPARVLW